MLVTVTCTAAAGYVLIRDNVVSLLDTERVRAVESGSVAAYALSAAASGGLGFQPEATDDNVEQVRELAASVQVTYGGETLQFALLDEAGNAVYTSLPERYPPALSPLRDPEQLSWQVREVSGSVHVLALQPTLLDGTLYYVGTARSAAHIYTLQLRQYRLLLKILAITVLLGGGVTLLVSTLLTRKLRAVTLASRRIAGGELACRADVRGSDEFARLAGQFNRMADTLEEKIDALQEENERRTLFTGAFAHELKTPLTSIIGYAELLCRGAQDERTALCAGYIYSEGRRLETLSMRLLELIVLQRHELQLQTVPAQDFFQQLAAAAAQPELQAAPAALRLEPALMQTVFLNLLDNARKACGPDGKISLIGERQGEDYLVRIRDNGCGMAPEELAKILRPFYRVDTSRSRAQGGVGLGLAICDEILKLHGFTLRYESAPGEGTTAIVTMKGAVTG